MELEKFWLASESFNTLIFIKLLRDYKFLTVELLHGNLGRTSFLKQSYLYFDSNAPEMLIYKILVKLLTSRLSLLGHDLIILSLKGRYFVNTCCICYYKEEKGKCSFIFALI